MEYTQVLAGHRPSPDPDGGRVVPVRRALTRAGAPVDVQGPGEALPPRPPARVGGGEGRGGQGAVGPTAAVASLAMARLVEDGSPKAPRRAPSSAAGCNPSAHR